MLYTKSIQAKKEPFDGLRVSIMRKPRGDYDMLISALAPSELLLNSYHENKINWDEYERAYLLEMRNNSDVEKILKFIIEAAKFTDITLLCWEETPDKCHRRLLLELIDMMSEKQIKVFMR
jgi:uncharacterized protein YeaO (DUF488 family)